MKQYIDTLQDVQGNALVGATVLVTNYIGGANANIYSDNGLTPITGSTVTTDSNGQFSFFCADADYTLTMSYNGAVYKTQSPVSIFDGTPQVTYPDTGTANAYAVSNAALEKQLRAGLRASFLAGNTNTGASTFSYNGLTAKSIFLPPNIALSAGSITAGGIYQIEYDGTNWQLKYSSSAAAIGNLIFPRTAAETAAGVTPVSYAYDSWRGDDVRRFGAVGDGTTDNRAVLVTANSVGASLYFPPGTYYISSSMTFSVPLFFDYGAILKPAANATITINAVVTAGLYQIFNLTNGNAYIAGRVKSSFYPVEWWGATGNGRAGSSGSIPTVASLFNDTNASFTSADVGKAIFITPPYFSALPPVLTTIASYNSATSINLTATPTWASGASFTATCSTTTLTVSAVASGTIFAGQTIKTGAASGTVINYQLTGTTGGVGTYNVSISQTISTGTAMTSSSPLSYYYGTDDTAAITAANQSVGRMALAESSVGYSPYQLIFNGGNIYLMSQQAVVGNPGTTAPQWKGLGGQATIAFGISSSTTNCVDVGTATSYVGDSFCALEDLYLDANFSGQDLIRLGGFQSPRFRNLWAQNSARDALSITPPNGSFLQQCDFQNVYLGPAGRHCIYVNPVTFANETDFLNLVMQYPSARQSGGTAVYFDTTTGAVESWNITNYKASTGWNGDPNYAPLGSWLYVAANNGIFPSVGLTLSNGYCEQGNVSQPIGATVAPIRVAAGSYATIKVRGFVAYSWGAGVTRADHDAASQFTVSASTTQQLMTTQAYFAAAIEFTINVSDGTNSDYYRFAAIGGKGATPNIAVIGSKVTVGTSPTYTVTATNVSNGFTVNFNNTGAVSLTVGYSAITKDCGSAPQYQY